jgi:hypothetical protein
MTTVKTLTIYPPNKLSSTQINPATPSLRDLQAIVGGLIQPVYFPDDPMGFWHVGYVNESGRLLNLEPNTQCAHLFPQYEEPFCGPCVTLEGFETYWWCRVHDLQPVRPGTREECLGVSQGLIQDVMVLEGQQVFLGYFVPGDPDEE